MPGRNQYTVRTGDRIALRHGARSDAIIGPRTQAIVDEWLDPERGLGLMLTPGDTAAVYAVAAAYARLAELTEYLEADDGSGKPRGALDARGRPRGCLRLYFQSLNAVMGGLRQLGATPAGRADMASALGIARSAVAASTAQAKLRQKHAEIIEAAEEPPPDTQEDL